MSRESLRADFYEEMVKFAKEMYGIDLKNWSQVTYRLLHMQDNRRYPVVGICRFLSLSKQAYYQHHDTQMQKQADEAFVVEYIKEQRTYDPGIGGNKLWEMYCKKFTGVRQMGYNRFYDIVEKYHLKVRNRKRRVQTTDSHHFYPVYDNLIKQIIPDRPW